MFLAVATNVKAEVISKKTTWKDYFTQDEAKMIKKMTQNYIIDQLDENANDWKGVISAKQVDKTIAKKKVFTGSITCDASFADKTTTGSDGDVYYKKISFDKIKLSETPLVQTYVKLTDSNERTQLDSNIWVISSSLISEGVVWVRFGDLEDGAPGIECDMTEYKVVVNY